VWATRLRCVLPPLEWSILPLEARVALIVSVSHVDLRGCSRRVPPSAVQPRREKLAGGAELRAEETGQSGEPRHRREVPSLAMTRNSRSFTTGSFTAWLGLIIGLVTAIPGCVWLHQHGVPGLEMYVKDEREQQVPHYREQFLLERDPEALNWLLANRVQNGMSVMEINHMLGEDGERIERDQRFKVNANEILQTDVAYQWGPDRNGRTIVLFFREGRLIQFRPDEFVSADDR
jgi:hypothetical protein